MNAPACRRLPTLAFAETCGVTVFDLARWVKTKHLAVGGDGKFSIEQIPTVQALVAAEGFAAWAARDPVACGRWLNNGRNWRPV